MLVPPTPVRTRRALPAAGLLLALLAVATVPLVVDRAATPVRPSGMTPTASTPRAIRPSVQAAVPPLRAPRLDVRIGAARDSGGQTVVLRLSGWIPDQFGWAAVEVMAAERLVGRSGTRVERDGSFEGMEMILSAADATAPLTVHLAGLNDVQLLAVPLLIVNVSTNGPAMPFRQPRSWVPR